jgi:hypothetical protein
MSKPKVVFENEVFRKILHWVDKSHVEVSGLGTVIFDEAAQVFRVKSAMLLPQKNTATHTDIDDAAVCKAMFTLKEAEGDLKFWWHSHVNMAVFWSGTDMDTIRQIGKEGWVLATVFNKKRESRSAFYGIGGLFPAFVDDLPTEALPFIDPMATQWDEEYKKNVTDAVFPQPTPLHGQTRTWVHRGGQLVEITSEGTPTQTIRTIGAQLSQKRTVASEEYAKIEPPEVRPKTMSRREYKRWKKEWRDAQHNKSQGEVEMGRTVVVKTAGGGVGTTLLDTDYVSGLHVTEADFVHPYPLTELELSLLAMEGWTRPDIDSLLATGMERLDILEQIFTERKTPMDCEDLIEDGEIIMEEEREEQEERETQEIAVRHGLCGSCWRNVERCVCDMDDIPVADRAAMASEKLGRLLSS